MVSTATCVPVFGTQGALYCCQWLMRRLSVVADAKSPVCVCRRRPQVVKGPVRACVCVGVHG